MNDQRQSVFLLRVVRIGFVSILLAVTMLYILSISIRDADELSVGVGIRWWAPVVVSLVLAGIFLTIDILTPHKKISIISGVVIGLVAGLVAAWVLGIIIDLVVRSWELQAFDELITAFKVLLGISLCYLGITTVLQTQDEFRLVIPYVEFAKQLRGPRPLLLDTSALIDARIVDIAATGLVQQTIVIPEFVIEELQALADLNDRMKRAKGKRGLDVVTQLQRMGTIDVVIDQSPVQKKAVDSALIELATQMPAMLVTMDMPLARVAAIQKVEMLNINELANALKPAVIPGNSIRVELIKRGEQDGQGVGYLEDGTMVVAEDGEAYIGQTRDMVITSSMQTAAGRLLFARVDRAEAEGSASGGAPKDRSDG
jgi:uncharacterized protein YacL